MPSDYQRIAHAIEWLEANAAEQPNLDALAGELSLSPFHCQRLFKRWAGITPKQFLQGVTAGTAKSHLHQRASVLDAALASGLSGPGRLHDHLITVDAATPGEIKHAGAGLTIRYGEADTPFGRAVIASTPRGICHWSFCDADPDTPARERLQVEWPQATLIHDDDAQASTVAQVFSSNAATSLRLHLSGTNFQLKVWQALLQIPYGSTTSYGALAEHIEQPSASRAVGTAVGANRIALLIPCHRVLRGTGAIGGYRWGVVRKKVLLAWERAKR